jgi:hypothetical protein
MAAVSVVDISPLDRTAGECFGAVNDVPQGVTVVGLSGSAMTCSKNRPPGARRLLVTMEAFAEPVRRGGLAFADALHLRGMEGTKFRAALALLLRADLRGPAKRWTNASSGTGCRSCSGCRG